MVGYIEDGGVDKHETEEQRQARERMSVLVLVASVLAPARVLC